MISWNYYFATVKDLKKHTEKLISKYNLNLKIRNGYAKWGHELSQKNLRILYGYEKIQLFKAQKGKHFYYITPAGVFTSEKKIHQLKFPFGLKLAEIEDANEFKLKIEKQLHFMEKMEKEKWIVDENEILDFDSEVGVIVKDGNTSFNVFRDYEGKWLVLPSGVKSIKSLLSISR